MDARVEKELQQLVGEAVEIDDALDAASEDDAAPETIEQAKRLTADFLDQYQGLLGRANADDRKQIERRLGGKVERINERLARLH